MSLKSVFPSGSTHEQKQSILRHVFAVAGLRCVSEKVLKRKLGVIILDVYLKAGIVVVNLQIQ